MIAVDIQSNAEALGKAIDEYRRITGKGAAQVLREKAARLAFALSTRLKLLAPEKGAIWRSALHRMLAGQGIRVRDTIKRRIMQKYSAASEISTGATTFQRGKRRVASFKSKGRRINLQNLMVRAELNRREASRGFLSFSSKYPKNFRGDGKVQSRFSPVLSQAKVKSGENTASLVFSWAASLSKLSASASEGLNQQRAQEAIAEALEEVREDILVYLARKNAEAKQEAGLK